MRIFAFEGRKIPEEQMEEINKEAVLAEDLQHVFENIIKYENKVKLNKWSVNVVKDNFEQLKEIIDAQKTLEEKQKENTIVGQIGQNLMWLSSGAYSYMPSLYSAEQERANEKPPEQSDQIQERPSEDQDEDGGQVQAKALAQQLENMSDTASFKDPIVEDEFEDAIDYPEASESFFDKEQAQPIVSASQLNPDQMVDLDKSSSTPFEQLSQGNNPNNTSFVTATAGR